MHRCRASHGAYCERPSPPSPPSQLSRECEALADLGNLLTVDVLHINLATLPRQSGPTIRRAGGPRRSPREEKWTYAGGKIVLERRRDWRKEFVKQATLGSFFSFLFLFFFSPCGYLYMPRNAKLDNSPKKTLPSKQVFMSKTIACKFEGRAEARKEARRKARCKD